MAGCRAQLPGRPVAAESVLPPEGAPARAQQHPRAGGAGGAARAHRVAAAAQSDHQGVRGPRSVAAPQPHVPQIGRQPGGQRPHAAAGPLYGRPPGAHGAGWQAHPAGGCHAVIRHQQLRGPFRPRRAGLRQSEGCWRAERPVGQSLPKAALPSGWRGRQRHWLGAGEEAAAGRLRARCTGLARGAAAGCRQHTRPGVGDAGILLRQAPPGDMPHGRPEQRWQWFE
mmetsp:Transcript_9749/g.27885  ORF Transcript_9749/g.27885 Transcript_9749/m.27885 type:complete len:226 (-) Transcript_9749:1990-2667(-)